VAEIPDSAEPHPPATSPEAPPEPARHLAPRRDLPAPAGAGRRPRRHTARDLAQIAVFAALIAALGLPGTISIGSTAVPITLQTLGVMLAGAVIGARKGLAAVAVFEVLVLAGLPLLAGGRPGGPQNFTVSPSAGYLYGFLAGAFVIGLLTARILPAYPLWLGIVVTAFGGIVVIYAFGVPWTAAVAHLPMWTAALDSLKFLPGDAIKVVATAVVAKQVHRAYPGLIPPTGRRDRVGRRASASAVARSSASSEAPGPSGSSGSSGPSGSPGSSAGSR
jgi:biotin transport system substrate-specific component